jgi:hypothetical protein
MGRTWSGRVLGALHAITPFYHKPYSGKLYRCVQISVPDNTIKDQILKLKEIQVARLTVQSWSMGQDGTEWFFRHFVRDQNMNDAPKMGRAWVIVKSSASAVKPLVTWSECLQFLSDVYNDPAIQTDPELKSGIYHIIDVFNSTDMEKSREIICEAKQQMPVTVAEVLVAPINSNEL